MPVVTPSAIVFIAPVIQLRENSILIFSVSPTSTVNFVLTSDGRDAT